MQFLLKFIEFQVFFQTQTHPTNNINTEGYPPFTFGENYAQNARLMTAGFEMGGLADMRREFDGRDTVFQYLYFPENPNPQGSMNPLHPNAPDSPVNWERLTVRKVIQILDKPLGDGERIDTAEVARKITNLINNTPSGKGKYLECVGGKMKDYKKYIDVFYDLKEYKELNEEGRDVFRRWYNWWNIPDDDKRKSILNMHETLKNEWFNMRSAKNAERIENKLKMKNQELKRKSDAVDEKNRKRYPTCILETRTINQDKDGVTDGTLPKIEHLHLLSNNSTSRGTLIWEPNNGISTIKQYQ
ncbi:hypothetical protein CRE_20103 [Caenorhabditis remanei]|uniref:CUT domain-containing protein n=1 Tax=Caenorhabditis remanei TaxID=31234 RepID=E3NNP4_CAERE|nr:hypothetical protein CRE_20103 [Caenorhabditis remanei]